jgi:hypothetical protein
MLQLEVGILVSIFVKKFSSDSSTADYILYFCYVHIININLAAFLQVFKTF